MDPAEAVSKALSSVWNFALNIAAAPEVRFVSQMAERSVSAAQSIASEAMGLLDLDVSTWSHATFPSETAEGSRPSECVPETKEENHEEKQEVEKGAAEAVEEKEEEREVREESPREEKSVGNDSDAAAVGSFERIFAENGGTNLLGEIEDICEFSDGSAAASLVGGEDAEEPLSALRRDSDSLLHVVDSSALWMAVEKTLPLSVVSLDAESLFSLFRRVAEASALVLRELKQVATNWKRPDVDRSASSSSSSSFLLFGSLEGVLKAEDVSRSLRIFSALFAERLRMPAESMERVERISAEEKESLSEMRKTIHSTVLRRGFGAVSALLLKAHAEGERKDKTS